VCRQGCYYYISIQGVDQENELLEQAITDREIRAARWNSRTSKVIEERRGHTPRGRIQHALEQIGMEWVTIEDRPWYYITMVASKERLSGLDHLVAINPTRRVTSFIFARLHGTRLVCPT
jgi:hypothetical protein